MKFYLISDEQIMKLYASGTAGSRNFERVIESVQRQEVNTETWEEVKKALKEPKE